MGASGKSMKFYQVLKTLETLEKIENFKKSWKKSIKLKFSKKKINKICQEYGN